MKNVLSKSFIAIFFLLLVACTSENQNPDVISEEAAAVYEILSALSHGDKVDITVNGKKATYYAYQNIVQEDEGVISGMSYLSLTPDHVLSDRMDFPLSGVVFRYHQVFDALGDDYFIAKQ